MRLTVRSGAWGGGFRAARPFRGPQIAPVTQPTRPAFLTKHRLSEPPCALPSQRSRAQIAAHAHSTPGQPARAGARAQKEQAGSPRSERPPGTPGGASPAPRSRTRRGAHRLTRLPPTPPQEGPGASASERTAAGAAAAGAAEQQALPGGAADQQQPEPGPSQQEGAAKGYRQPTGAYSQREDFLIRQEQEGELAYHYVVNDGQPHNMMW